MALQGQKFDIDFINPSIRYREYTDSNAATWNYFPVAAIRSVTQVQIRGFGDRDLTTNQRKNPIRNTDLLRISIDFHDADRPAMVFDIQNVMNQVNWTPNQVGVNNALAMINVWIGAGTGSGSSSPATEETLQQLVDQGVGSDLTYAIEPDFSIDGSYQIGSNYSNYTIFVVEGAITLGVGNSIQLQAGTVIPFETTPNRSLQGMTIFAVDALTAKVLITAQEKS